MNLNEYQDEMKLRVELLYSFAVGDDRGMHGLPRKEAAGIAIDMLVQCLGALSGPLDCEGKALVIEYLVDSMNQSTARIMARQTLQEAARHD